MYHQDTVVLVQTLIRTDVPTHEKPLMRVPTWAQHKLTFYGVEFCSRMNTISV